MDKINTYRDGIIKTVGRELGFNTTQDRKSVGQSKVRGHEAELFQLPVDARDWQPLQDPDTGEVFFMADYDPLP